VLRLFILLVILNLVTPTVFAREEGGKSRKAVKTKPVKAVKVSRAKARTKKYKTVFDKKLFAKLTPKNKSKYLKAYAQFVVEMEKHKRATRASMDYKKIISEMLLPVSFAATKSCLTGGIYYPPAGDNSCGVLPDEATVNIKGADAFYSCGVKQRCAVFFGTGGDGKGLCWKDEGRATRQCNDQMTDEGRMAIIDKLKKCDSGDRINVSECEMLNKLLDNDFRKNPLLDQDCLEDVDAREELACERLSEALMLLFEDGVLSNFDVETGQSVDPDYQPPPGPGDEEYDDLEKLPALEGDGLPQEH